MLIASPLEGELAARIQAADPRAEVLFEPDLLPPARYPADHRGDPEFRRDAGGEARWRALLDRAEVLFGVPGDSAADLAEVVTGLPRLRWVHATSAGAGEQVRHAELPAEALERVTVTTSSGEAISTWTGVMWLRPPARPGGWWRWRCCPGRRDGSA